MINDMLTYSKERTPEYRPTSLNDLVAETVNMVRGKLQENGIVIIQDCDPGIGILMLDEHGIHSCLMNLLSNALDSLGDRGGRITIKTKLDKNAGEVTLQVSDTGCGISEEDLDKIFDIFYSTKGSRGTGFGLPVTKKIIHEHGGSLSVQSTKAAGTTFSVCLPLQ